MSKNAKLCIYYIAIADSVLYLLVVMGYFIFQTSTSLTCWETTTIISAPIILLVLLSILDTANNDKEVFKTSAIVFMGCTTALTATAHFVNITVTRVLEANGIGIPYYFKIGQWPSVEMAIDYLAWGFFMGLALIFTAVAMTSDADMKKIKYTTYICGGLCLLGMLGPLLGNEILWFIAVAGYAVGIPVICIQMILLHKKQMNRS